MPCPGDYPPAPPARAPHVEDRAWVPWVVVTTAVVGVLALMIVFVALLPGP